MNINYNTFPQAEQVEDRASHVTWGRIKRKTDTALLPFLSLLYLLNGLDRSSVGNAETQGFSKAIGITQDDFNLAVSLFFVTFVLLQAPSTAVGRWLGAKHWIAIMMIGWGVSTTAHAFVKSRSALFTARLLVGAFESGYYPTAVSYLSTFYCRYDMAVRLALFYGQYAIAGAFSGAIAFGIFHLKGLALQNWQYLFIMEGSLTVLLAIVAWVWLPDGPASAWFLDHHEREFAAKQINNDTISFRSESDEVKARGLTKRDFIEAGKDWKTWYVLLFNICASVPSQTFSVFLPLVVVHGFGFSSIEANLVSVPPFICGAVGLYLVAFSSDRHQERGYHIIFGISITLFGLIIVVTAESNGGKYVGLCVLLTGSYISPPLTMAWLSGNTPEPGKRYLVLGVNGFGNLAGVIGSQLYRAEYAPRYLLPFYVTLGFVAAALVGYSTYRYFLLASNKRRMAMLRIKTESEIRTEQMDSTRYADRKWTFIYGL